MWREVQLAEGVGDDPKRRLLDMLVKYSYRRDVTPVFRLSSGQRSTYYIDCKSTTMRAEAMPLVGEVFSELLPLEVAAVGGLTLGADAIAGAIAFHSTIKKRNIDSFTVRKEPKKHGLRKFIEGCPAADVAIVDDVVTTGASTIEAIKRCREAGLVVRAVLILVDREEASDAGRMGIAAIRDEAGQNVPVNAVFTRSDLERRDRELNRDDLPNSPRHRVATG